MKKYVLAYSGGLDTSVILKWLKVNHQVDVVTVTANLGQKGELEGLREKAMATGASQAFIDDLRNEFVSGYVWPSLAAGALYQPVQRAPAGPVDPVHRVVEQLGSLV